MLMGSETRRRGRGFRARLVIPACGLALVGLTGVAHATVGGLTQKPGTEGCISETGSGGECADGSALDGAVSVAVSADGKDIYVAAGNSNAVSWFTRGEQGVLTPAGCVSETGSGGCADGKALLAPQSVAISPDGESVYVASFTSSAIAIFDRDPTTGALTQKAGTAGCIWNAPASVCAEGKGLGSTNGVAVSPDGENVYAAAFSGDAVAIFDRDAEGGLTQPAAPAGCIWLAPAGDCQNGKALDGARRVTVSPDGKNIYVAAQASKAVAVFDRDLTTGALVQKQGFAGCVSFNGSGGNCANGVGLGIPVSVTVSPDGKNLYAASGALAVFDRDPTTGVLTQKAGLDGCISQSGTSEDGDGGSCTDGRAIQSADAVAISPDGRNAYLAANGQNAVSIFDRDPAGGALVQKAGAAGCISEAVLPAGCADGRGLLQAASVVSAPGGENVYVAGLGDVVATFDRDIPPDTAISSGPGFTTTDTTPTFAFSSSEGGSSFECRIDAGSFGACSGPGDTHTTFALSPGPHRFEVRAIDASSNPDDSPASADFEVAVQATPPPAGDVTPPGLRIVSRPKRVRETKFKKPKVSVSFESEPGAKFICKVNVRPAMACKSPFKTAIKAKPGKGRLNTITIAAFDAAGNASKPAVLTVRAILID